MCKRLSIFVFLAILFATKGIGQKNFTRTLFLNEDSSTLYGCGTMLSVTLFYFVSDTCAYKAKKEYFIMVKCADSYGQNFFKKGRKYKAWLTKDFTSLKNYIGNDELRGYKKLPNLSLAIQIKLL